MRILAVTNLYPNPWQPGRAPFNQQQLLALAAEHELRVIAPVAWTDEWRSARRGSSPASMPQRSRVEHGFIVHHPRYLFPPRILRASYGLCFQRSIRATFNGVVRDFRPEVVLACWAYPDGWATVRLAREAGLPVALKVHGSDLLTAGRRADRRAPTSEALARADAVIAVSRHLGATAAQLGADPGRLHVVHNGVDDSVFGPRPRPECRERLGEVDPRPLLLFVGNLVPVKGPDVLLDALASVRQCGAEFRCIFIGEGPLRSGLQSRAEALGLSASVQFVGLRPHAELPLWYSAADLLVVPSRSEGIPNVLLEASACGTPFVATRVGGVPEIAAHESLVDAGDVHALADRIREAIENPRRPAAPRHTVGTWNDSARALARVLGQVVTEHRGRAARAA